MQPGEPVALVRSDDSSASLTTEAGGEMSPFSFAAMDCFGNRTAPAYNEPWQVRQAL